MKETQKLFGFCLFVYLSANMRINECKPQNKNMSSLNRKYSYFYIRNSKTHV